MRDEREMIELLADSWKTDDNGCQMTIVADSLYRWCSQCGANIDMDCTAIG